MQQIENDVSKAVQNKFGLLIETKQKGLGDFALLVKRSNATFPDAPYMTIRAFHDGKAWSFHWGHYDLTLAKAIESFKTR